MDFSIDQCQNYRDKRGNLIQFVSEKFLSENNLPLGQIYLLTFDGQNVIRGNHYHLLSSEIFCLIQGEIEMALEDIETKERFSKIFSAADEVVYRVRIGPKIAHAIKSISDSAVLVSYASSVYDPLNEDKFVYKLL
jgi:dTDP-4-dehydrorhamnose 3,5-epimerase-like enzyme